MQGPVCEIEAAFIKSTNASLGHHSTFHRLGNYTEAAEVFREWLAHDPDNPFARHMLAATSGAGALSRAEDKQMRQLFG